MPELPEVEVVRRGLEEHVIGRTFERVDVLHPRANRGQDAPLAPLLEGATIAGAHRRGKYLWLSLASDTSALLVHLGMSGQMLVGNHGACTSKHLRIRASLDENLEIAFVDQRTFGRWLLTDTDQGIPTTVTHIAPDPLDPLFDLAATVGRLRAKRTKVKSVLLDQTIVSGIGNIYADEALWRAQINPAQAASSLTREEATELLLASEGVMRDSLAEGGTSFDSLYVNVNGASGYFARGLNAYGRTGQPCPRCGTAIMREKFMNRSSHFCPVCQRKR